MKTKVLKSARAKTGLKKRFHYSKAIPSIRKYPPKIPKVISMYLNQNVLKKAVHPIMFISTRMNGGI
ncbi:MAG: hypothetical protein ABIS36_18995 [Chryseolinea sp.]